MKRAEEKKSALAVMAFSTALKWAPTFVEPLYQRMLLHKEANRCTEALNDA